MRVTIIVEDDENGHVKIKTTPSISTLVEIANNHDGTPAEHYGFVAIRALVDESKKIDKDGHHISTPGADRLIH